MESCIYFFKYSFVLYKSTSIFLFYKVYELINKNNFELVLITFCLFKFLFYFKSIILSNCLYNLYKQFSYLTKTIQDLLHNNLNIINSRRLFLK